VLIDKQEKDREIEQVVPGKWCHRIENQKEQEQYACKNGYE